MLRNTTLALVDPNPQNGNRWLIGNLVDGWSALPYEATETVVRADWSRVIATRQEESELVVEDWTAGTPGRVVYRGAPATSSVLSGGAPDGSVVIAGVDLGVLLVSPAGEIREVVAPADSTMLQQRGDLKWSDTGQTVASPLCTQVSCDVDIVRIESGETTTLAGFVTLAISDDFALGYDSENDRRWRVRSLATGGEVTADVDTIERPYDAVVRRDGRFVLSGEAANGTLVFTIADPRGGPEQTIRTDPTASLVLYPWWRDEGYIVVGPRSGAGEALKGHSVFVVVPTTPTELPVQVEAPAVPALGQ